MESHALATGPLPLALQAAAPFVDLPPHDVDMADVLTARLNPWEWCREWACRFVAGTDERVRRRLVDDTIKGHDRNRGADHHQLDAVLGALDRGLPVVMSSWWPTTPTVTDTLGIAAIDVPPPSSKGRDLIDGHVVVALGYGRHDAFPGGGYLIVLDPTTGETPADDESTAGGTTRYVPFTYVQAYAIALKTAHIVSGRLRPADEPADQGEPSSALPELPIGPSQHPVDVQIARKARCADPRASYTALFFSENAIDTARAKAICARCEVRDLCLARALERAEPYGVWGGEFLIDGEIMVAKRGRGRPRRIPLPTDVDEVTGMPAAS
jgi:WhiB family redox-sensing transcriptional regulator